MTEQRAFAGRIMFPTAEGVIYGAGSARAELAGILRRVGAKAPFLVTTPSVVRAGLAAEVASWLEPSFVGSFEGSVAHTPVPVVEAATEAARFAGADCLVSLGGSSVVDLTKGVALLLAEGGPLRGHRVHSEPGQPAHRPHLSAAKLAHIAVPTTLSGAEFTGAAGITDLVGGAKEIYLDPKLTPRWVIFDPELVRATPPLLWAATGMKVLSDTVEVLCSRRATPLSDAVAAASLAMLASNLGPATLDAEDLDARVRCQFAVAMALPQLAVVGVGLVAALRHQLGGGLGVGHGVASTIVLPHVLRWNGSAAAEALGRAAAALGLAGPEALIGRIEALTVELGLPTRLRDVDVAPEQFDGIVDHVLGDGSARTNCRPATAQGVREILSAAW